MYIVTNHVEDTTATPIPTDTLGACDRPHLVLTSSESMITPTLSEPVTTNTATNNHQPTACPSVVTVTAAMVTVMTIVEATPSAMVQRQSEASSDSSDDCNIIAIVVPTVLVFIALLVVICISIVVVKIALKRRKSASEDIARTSVNPHVSFVVENDLYQLVII